MKQIVAAKMAGITWDGPTAEWVANLGDELAAKLARLGLIPTRESSTLKRFLDQYVESRADVKESTSTVYGHTRRNLIDYFGADKPLRAITSGDADQWRLWLVSHEKLTPNTVRRRSGIAKQFCNRSRGGRGLVHFSAS